MEKCRHCGADRQEEHTYCPACGKKLALTVAEYAIIRRKTETIFFEDCAKRKDVPKAIRKVCARASWEVAAWQHAYRLEGRAPDDELPGNALLSLALVRAKAEDLFSLMLG